MRYLSVTCKGAAASAAREVVCKRAEGDGVSAHFHFRCLPCIEGTVEGTAAQAGLPVPWSQRLVIQSLAVYFDLFMPNFQQPPHLPATTWLGFGSYLVKERQEQEQEKLRAVFMCCRRLALGLGEEGGTQGQT